MNYDAQSNEYRQGKKDCVIVSIANYLKIDYNKVINALYSVGGIEAIDRLPVSGVQSFDIIEVLKYLTGKRWITRNPRRGQEKFNGFVSWHRPNVRKGHLTIVRSGLVFDTDGMILPLPEYRARFRYVSRDFIVCID